MANWREVCTEIVTLLQTVTGLGSIFDYPPDLRDPTSFKDLATSWDENLPIINVWFVERVGAADVRGGTAPGVPLTKAVRRDRYLVTGIYGYAKGGKTVWEFQALVEAVLDKLLDYIHLGRRGDWVAKAATLRLVGFRAFGDYLSHTAEIELEVERWLTPTFQ